MPALTDVPGPLPRDSASPAVFVVGCPRSGTTLLQRMLDAHPQLAVVNDSHFIPRAVETLAPQLVLAPERAADWPLSRDAVQWVRGYHRFGRMGLSERDVDEAAAGASTYAQFVGRLYAACAAVRGKSLSGEKTPDYVRHIPLLAALFPQARFVHIVRDGRDVALSLVEWARPDKGPGKLARWADEPLAVAALWWRWQAASGRRDGTHLPAERYLEVRYESLVADAATELARLAAFLNLPCAPQMADFHVGRARPAARLRDAKQAWLPPTPGLRNWRTQLPAESVELFEALAGDALTEFGYRRAAGDLRPAIAARAEDCRAWWQAEQQRRAMKLHARAQAAGDTIVPSPDVVSA